VLSEKKEKGQESKLNDSCNFHKTKIRKENGNFYFFFSISALDF